jgi:hypothetical protein
MDTRYAFMNLSETRSNEGISMIDSASDTFGIGGPCWIVESLTDRKVSISGYDKDDTTKENIHIGTGITAIDLP